MTNAVRILTTSATGLVDSLQAKYQRVLVVTSQRNHGKGGIQTWSEGLYRQASKAGRHATIWGVRDGGLLAACRGVQGLFRANYLVFANWKYFAVMLPELMVRRLFGSKPYVIVLVHGLELADLRPRLICMINFAATKLDVEFFANSEFTMDRARQYGLQGDWEVRRPIAILPDLDIRANQKQGREVLSITRLVERKNLFRAIDAVVALNHAGANLDYKIIGEGPLFSVLAEYAKQHGGGRVHLLGAADEATKWCLLKNADIFLLPSVDCEAGRDFEGYGLALIEANWVGVPVVAGPSGGMPEAVQVGRTGYVSDGTVTSIADCIQKVLSKPLPVAPIRAWAAQHRASN